MEEKNKYNILPMLQELKKIWPYNLIADLVVDEKEDMFDISLPGLFEAIETLTEREQRAIYLRYEDHLTLEKCSKSFGVNRERVRQILAKACRKLRHPSRFCKIKAVRKSEMIERDKTINELIIQVDNLTDENNKLRSKVVETNPQTAEDSLFINKINNAATISIDDMDLTVRSYNCLKRTGVDTMLDLTMLSETDLMKVRNLGHKSLEEIIHKVKDMGFTLREDNDDPLAIMSENLNLVDIHALSLHPESVIKLRQSGIYTVAKLAELSVDEFIDIVYPNVLMSNWMMRIIVSDVKSKLKKFNAPFTVKPYIEDLNIHDDAAIEILKSNGITTIAQLADLYTDMLAEYGISDQTCKLILAKMLLRGTPLRKRPSKRTTSVLW